MVRRIVNQCIIFLCVLLCACGGAQEARRVRAGLDDVASYINDRPDSALAVLRGIDSESLLSRKDRARAALLHSVALDKCYVDITSDSILAPALAYYRHHGTADQRLKARYYRSVLARNAGDRDAEMAWLVEAERFIPRAHDPEMAGFIYAAKRELFLDLLDTENAYKNAIMAASAFQRANAARRYHNAIISLAMLAQMQENYEESARWIDSLMVHSREMTPRQQGELYSLRLAQAAKEDIHAISELIQDLMSGTVDERSVLWLSVASAYWQSGNPEEAAMALEKALTLKQTSEEDVHYLLLASRISESLGQIEQSAEYFAKYHQLLKVRQVRARESSARFLEERKHLQGQRRGWFYVWIGSAVLALLVMVLLAMEIRRRRRESLREREIFSEYTRTVGNTEQFLVSRLLSAGLDGTMNEMERNTRLKEVLIEWRKLFSLLVSTVRLSHPKFIDYLEKRDLTLREMGYCCLFAEGYTLKECSSYYAQSTGAKNNRSFYNMTSAIRKKLALTDGKDLDEYIRDLVNE